MKPWKIMCWNISGNLYMILSGMWSLRVVISQLIRIKSRQRRDTRKALQLPVSRKAHHVSAASQKPESRKLRYAARAWLQSRHKGFRKLSVTELWFVSRCEPCLLFVVFSATQRNATQRNATQREARQNIYKQNQNKTPLIRNSQGPRESSRLTATREWSPVERG